MTPMMRALLLAGCAAALTAACSQAGENQADGEVAAPALEEAAETAASAPVPAGRSESIPETDIADTPRTGNFEAVEIAAGLTEPWDMEFLPNGDLLFTEKAGRVRIVRGGVLDPEPIPGAPEVFYRRQGGMMDIELDPDFATNSTVYLSYSHGDQAQNATRIARAVFDGAALLDVEPIFTIEPWKDTPVHYGGVLEFLPDGTLLLTSGDGFNYREEAQDKKNLLGKIIRINKDGSIPEDNPFVGDENAHPAVYSLGHRNPQGLVAAPDGRIYSNEHGPRGGDELNVIVPGGNYGWPIATYGTDYSGATISPFTSYEGTIQPIIAWDPSIAPSSMIWHDGGLVIPALALNMLVRVDMENGEPQGQAVLFEGERLRSVAVGPDGLFYVATDNRNDHSQGRILRLEPR